MPIGPMPPPPPGHKIIFSPPGAKDPRLLFNSSEAHKEQRSRTQRLSDRLRVRELRKAEILKQIYDVEEEPIDPEELSKTPLFQFGAGFTKDLPPEYRYGEEPAFAPLSQEQTRLLLVHSLPTSMVPFVLDRFQFNFKSSEHSIDEPPPGPTISFTTPPGGLQKKIVVTFYQSNFYTHGVPPRHQANGTSRSLDYHPAAFLDPTKISMFLGRIIAKMIEPPEKWAEMIDPEFQVTVDKTIKKKRRLKKKIPKDIANAAHLSRQWEDFVSLALANPETAKERNPEAYDYFIAETEKFSLINHDTQAITKLEKLTDQDGIIQLPDIQTVIDTRSAEQKMEDQPLSPQLAFYEHFITGLNRFTSNLGFIITYKKPKIASSMKEADDAEIKSFMENKTPEERDLNFGDILSDPHQDFDKEARATSRQLLLAFSQVGEFHEWRAWAYLYKFSRTFRKTKGKHISEEDYEDLKQIYGQSEKIGNRIGTSVLPYEAVNLTPEKHADAAFYGREVRVFVRTDYRSYYEKVQERVLNKTPRELLNVNQKAFEFFKTPAGWVPLTAKFGSTGEGLQTVTGPFTQFMNETTAKTITSELRRIGVNVVPPDAIAATKGLQQYIKDEGQRANKYVTPLALSVVRHYGPELNEPPEIKVKKLLAWPAAEIAKTDLSTIYSTIQEAEAAEQAILHTIGIAAGARPLAIETQQELTRLIEEGVSDNTSLLRGINNYTQNKFGPGSFGARQEYFTFVSVLFSKPVQDSLILFRQVRQYEKEITPRYADNFHHIALDIKEDPSLILGDRRIFDDPENERFKLLAKHHIIDLGELKRTGTEETVPKEEVTEGTTTTVTETPITITDEQTRAQREAYIKDKLAAAPPEALTLVGLDYASEAMKELDNYLYDKKLGDTKRARLDHWLEASGRIFKAKHLKPIATELQTAVSFSDQPAKTAQGYEAATRGDNQLALTSEEINRSIGFEQADLDPKSLKKPEPPKGETNRREDEE